MLKNNYRIIVRQTETVVDDGPHSGDTTGKDVVLWCEKRPPNDLDMLDVKEHIPPDLELVAVKGLRRQFGMIEDVLIARDACLSIQKRKAFLPKWTPVDSFPISELEDWFVEGE